MPYAAYTCIRGQWLRHPNGNIRRDKALGRHPAADRMKPISPDAPAAGPQITDRRALTPLVESTPPASTGLRQRTVPGGGCRQWPVELLTLTLTLR
jgi:hypothetical protein